MEPRLSLSAARFALSVRLEPKSEVADKKPIVPSAERNTGQPARSLGEAARGGEGLETIMAATATASGAPDRKWQTGASAARRSRRRTSTLRRRGIFGARFDRRCAWSMSGCACKWFIWVTCYRARVNCKAVWSRKTANSKSNWRR